MIVRLELQPASAGRTVVLLGNRVMAVGRGSVICAAARILLAELKATTTDRLEAYRGDMLAMCGTVGAFAALEVTGDTPRFRKYVEGRFPARGGGAGALELVGGSKAGDDD